tara:strand:- start:1808 stop:2485 length:678 start_codon:yes stop_codon:yes gene_type:complete
MRFAASNGRNTIAFNPFRLSGRGGESIGRAAGMSTLPSVWKSIQKNKPNYAKIGAYSMLGEASRRNAISKANAQTEVAKWQAWAQKKAANAQAKASRAQGRNNMIGGLVKGVGSIALGALMMSDKTTKNTIERLENATQMLRELKPVSFYYNKEYSLDPERKHYGFIAQEYKEQLPDATYTDESTGKLCIDTNELIGVLVAAFKELEGRITRLEVKNVLEAVGVK